MLIVGTFLHCTELELALSLLEHNGIDKSRIMVIPMDFSRDMKSSASPQIATDAERAFEIGLAFATAVSVIGVSVGFSLYLGPLLWGLFFAAGGLILAFSVSLWFMLYRKRKMKGFGERSPGRIKKANRPEVTVIVQCGNENSEKVRQILWDHRAITVGKMEYEQTASTGESAARTNRATDEMVKG